jgi:starch synthase (maltosyl-transferring)
MSNEVINLGNYQITIDTTHGLISGLQVDDCPQTLGHGDGPLPLGASLAWQAIEAVPRYISHTASDDQLVITLALEPLRLHDHYTVSDGLIERRVRVENTSDREVQLTGLRIGLGGVCIGAPEDCTFEAPGNVIRPRLPLQVAASQPTPGRAPAAPDATFAPGAAYRFGNAFGDAPDVGPGLMVVHNGRLGWSLLTWFFSTQEAATPWVGGDGKHATVGFDLGLAGWLAPGQALEGGTQYIMLRRGDYQSALDAYRACAGHSGITPPIYGEIDRAQDWIGVYEVHPGQFGGFEGLRKALPKIAHMGIDTLYLMPVMAHRNKTGRAWDGNWENGSPYAVLDFETFEPSLGNESQFKALVESAHALGMRALMDLVTQGCGLEARYVKEHPDWFARDEQGDMVHSHGWNDTWSFDWANSDFQAYMLGVATHHLVEYDIDGFRVDAPHGKEPNWDRSIPYHASQTGLGIRTLLEDLRRAERDIKPDAVLYCELFGPMWIHSHDIANDYHPYAMVMQLFENKLTPTEFNEYLRDYWAIIPRSAEGHPAPRICFTETHDTRLWPVYALRGSAISRALLGILVMGGFVPMIWSGQEEGQEDFIRGLMLSRRENEVLRRGRFLFNEVGIDDENHYRRDQGDDPAGAVYTIVRYDEEKALFGVASLFPEQVTFRFSLPVDKLPIARDKRYQLRDLISYQCWGEYGQETWTGEELASFHLTPRMYTPYIFRIEEVEE